MKKYNKKFKKGDLVYCKTEDVLGIVIHYKWEILGRIFDGVMIESHHYGMSCGYFCEEKSLMLIERAFK